MGDGYAPVSAVSDDGSGSDGGSGGYPGGGRRSGGGGGGESGGLGKGNDGALANGNSSSYRYLELLTNFPVLTKAVTSALLTLIGDLICQFVFTPVFIGIFLSALVILEGRPSHVVPKLEQEWFSSVLANWQLWIPFQFLNFRFVPQQFQVLASNVVSLVWNVILSSKAHKEVSPK
ncbi:hypothetical protein Cgig2_001389 [Carnegiea gigantea]|uniref:Uncharacterized protein n=1 Tax=Carnegiea gigantea TaxID=171969 RepID=A0A9Q1KVP1_9CARY|nr:hypothetical protein Cgig2_001389 [Carnegiea gigantea]